MYARIFDNIVCDPVPATSQLDVGRFFHPDYIVNHGGLVAWVEVPEGTKHGAVQNGDTFTNPDEPAVPETPQSATSQILDRLATLEAKIDALSP